MSANAVTARWEYAEGGSITVTVQVDTSYPDALDEARCQAVRGLRDAMAEGAVDQLDGDG